MVVVCNDLVEDMGRKKEKKKKRQTDLPQKHGDCVENVVCVCCVCASCTPHANFWRKKEKKKSSQSVSYVDAVPLQQTFTGVSNASFLCPTLF